MAQTSPRIALTCLSPLFYAPKKDLAQRMQVYNFDVDATRLAPTLKMKRDE